MHRALLAIAAALFLQQAEPPRPSFAEFLADVRNEARSRGIRPEVLDEALRIDEPLPVVIERDRSQAELVLPLEQYVRRRLTPRMIRKGHDVFASNQQLLDDVSAKYGVPAGIIVGIWGLESNFGRFSGVHPTVAALATLAWEGRRAAFFRRELLDALEILNRRDIEPAKLRGSWAGAMGQVQFMPSSYLQFAEDYDRDGRKDIWSSTPDVFASIANYLKGHGWTAGEGWGREVAIPADARRRIRTENERRSGTCQATRDMTAVLPAARWNELGVRTLNGKKLPATMPDAALVSGETRTFLVYRNYDTLLDYNCSHAYAISVALLAARVSAGQTPDGSQPATSTVQRRSSRPRQKS